MNTDKLRYLIEVEKMKIVSKAAENLNISQSAVSQAIAEFEKLLGYPLFNRTKLGMVPTKHGNRILAKSREILEKVQELENELYRDNIHNEIRIGSYPGFMPNFIKTIGEFKETHTNTKIFITEDDNKSILAKVKEKKIEAGFIIWPDGFPEKNEELKFERIAVGRFILCINKNFTHFNKGFISQQELREVPLILFEDVFVQGFIDDFEKEFGKLNFLFRTNQADAARNALIENLGVLIGPNFTFLSDPNIVNGILDTLEVVEFQNRNLNLGWVTSTSAKPHSNTRQLINQFNKENTWPNK